MSWLTRRKWLALTTAGTGGAAVVALLAGRGGGRSAEQAALDASEPGWDLASLLDANNSALPDAGRNPFALVTYADRDLGPAGVATLNAVPPLDHPLNARLTPAERGAASATLSPVALAVLAPLAELPEGGRPVRLADCVPDLSLPIAADPRTAQRLLELDAVLHADAGRADAAVATVRRMVAVPRALGAEPLGISRLVRVATALIAARTAVRVLNLSEPRTGLAELQSELLAESARHDPAFPVRAERAFADASMEELGATRGPLGRLVSGHDRDHAAMLQTMTTLATAAGLPPAERGPAVAAAVAGPHPPLVGSLVAAAERQVAAAVRAQATLVTAAVAVACERHRQATGNWPAALADLAPGVMTAVPLDPFTGSPLLYKRLPDGVVVYSVGDDLADGGGAVWAGASSDKPIDVGVRLFDPSLRGVPAR